MIPSSMKTIDNLPADFRKRFFEDGFFVYENLCTPEETNLMRSHVAELLEQRERWPRRMFLGVVNDDKHSVPTALDNPHVFDSAFLEWASNEKILAAMRELLGPHIALYSTAVFMKPPHHSGTIPWHQDQIYYEVAVDFLVQCWVALTDVTLNNGCLKYVRGSHKQGIIPTENPQDPKAAVNFDKAINKVEEDKVVFLPIPAGSAVFHHSLVLHSSGPNLTEKPRWAVSSDFMNANYRFTGNPEKRRCYPVLGTSR